MKRDLDLVRCILVTSEDAPDPVDGTVLSRCCGDLQKVAFHVELMRSHGLIEAEVSYDGFNRVPLGIEVKGLTWEGYDYLDAIRSPQVWWFWCSDILTGNRTYDTSYGACSRFGAVTFWLVIKHLP